jgi:hypothetical protein
MKMNNTGRKQGTRIKWSEIISPENVSDMILPWPQSKRKGSSLLVPSEYGYFPHRFRINLYRFFRDNIPLLHACIWTWSRLSSAPGRYEITGSASEDETNRALGYLDDMLLRIYPFRFHKSGGLESFLPMLFSSLYTDGAFAGFVIVDADAGGIDRFLPLDPARIRPDRDRRNNDICLMLETDNGDVKLDGSDFCYFGLNADTNSGLGRSILSAIPFVTYIEQQLLDDMRRATHNAGYHRLHVQITPPEKLSGESDSAYVDRVNEYFDETVGMIKGCEPEDNPVTWDNVRIEYIGPRNIHGVTNSWFLNHRAMVEEICSGTNLSPFMLGYNYGTTHNWAQFKYDLVMRQITSSQRQKARFLEWLGNIELGLKGLNCTCRYIFDNSLTYLASERAEIEKGKMDSLIKLYSAGLIPRETAAQKAGDLI